ncbi:antibiotic biosynthesis monooxygenase family protein [Sinomicrobium weinanense]|uniref:Antibiotic biosynthesis monooxygenase n=1 Tax=Sinomicrobium weinanense TaxID=2842200 RepID=A0A926JN96_9FLAO|nr:antibiotic biosynthesis monooxygenase [Sinomicrobium weinanense]MBC9794417.1 antibiotic biosynthesis monooxygenase [Sinomicrobium weinanense]MBU3124324.1 antibiotic biosynthesis monooxygenase [Sinomicrobium weinanense]
MIAVIFEVELHPENKQDYLDIAAYLKGELEKTEGFISVERFQSLTQPEKLLSLSFWKDEEAVKSWRTLQIHREAQTKGRAYVFKDYRLRVADVNRDYGMSSRQQAPEDSKKVH